MPPPPSLLENGKRDGSAGKGAYHGTWQPEFKSRGPTWGGGGDGERMDCCKVFSDLQEPTTHKHTKERNKNIMKMNKQINTNPPKQNKTIKKKTLMVGDV